MKQRRLGNVLSLLVGVGLIVVAGFGLWQREFIFDSISAQRFEPTSEIAALAEASRLSQRGKMLFYASQPALLGAEEFNQACKNVEVSSAVLGCYSGGQIYIYNVDNPELTGIHEVTAAHEMLHAAYDRLSSDARRDVNNLLNQAALSMRSNQAFAERLNAYDFVDSDEKHNELHSILATEVEELGEELEAHYQQYFINRQQVVSLYQQYSGIFSAYQAQAADLASTLDQQAAAINVANDAYRSAVSEFESEVTAFNRRADSGDFTSQSEFDQARNQLLARQDGLTAQRQQITASIEQYNRLLEEYNGIARHITSLSNSLDSRVIPTPEVD